MITHSIKVDVEGMAININGKTCSLKQAGKSIVIGLLFLNKKWYQNVWKSSNKER